MSDTVDPRDLEKLWDTLANNKSDREIAIVALAYLEDYLARAIRSKMPGLNSDIKDRLFSVTGILSPIAAQIDLAAALAVINVHERSDFITLARIRNRFAHKLHVDGFDHPEVSKLTGELRVVKDIVSGTGKFEGGGQPPDIFKATWGSSPKGRFMLAANIIAINLYNHLFHSQRS